MMCQSHPGTVSGCIRDRQKCKWLRFGKTADKRRGAFQGDDPDALQRLVQPEASTHPFAASAQVSLPSKGYTRV